VPFFKGDTMKKEIQKLKELNSGLAEVCRNKTIKIIELEKKIKHLKELDEKSFLSILKLQNKIKDYETNYVDFSKYDELHNNYIVLLQAYDNIKNKKEVKK
tara:strand:- start:280 stop:582 length:303 start_codon:yes stop_codon:yes gene_type:complete